MDERARYAAAAMVAGVAADGVRALAKLLVGTSAEQVSTELAPVAYKFDRLRDNLQELAHR